MKTIYLFIISFILTSCNFFAEDQKMDETILNEPSLFEIEETKKFNYINELIHYKNGFDKDTIRIVLKEYYKSYKHYIYDDESNLLQLTFSNTNDYLLIPDFINKLEKKYNIERKDLFLIANEIDVFFKTEQMDELETISEEVQDLNSRFNNN